MLSIVMMIWGITPIFAKTLLTSVSVPGLGFLNFGSAALFTLTFKLLRDRSFRFRLRDVPFFFLNALFGNVGYQLTNYAALEYLSAGVVAVVIASIPLMSVLMEFLFHRNAPGWRAVVFIAVCIFGVSLVIGVDLQDLVEGKVLGYIFAFGSVVSWGFYGILMEKMVARYSSQDLSVYQLCASAIILAPFYFANPAPTEFFSTHTILVILFLSIGGSSVGYMLYNKSLSYVGAMPCALFANFMPVVTVIGERLILGASLSPLQIVGMAVVIISACFVIRFKNQRPSLNR
jgi:drug/metabolite transporter (DMT)-like permease